MNTVQSTAYGLEVMLRMLFGHPPAMDAKSTINERLDILGNARPTATEKMQMGILVAGNKGHEVTVGNGGIGLTSILDHMSTNASVYNPMPFCMRTVDEDLPLAQRIKYALRKEVTVGGINYYAYYGLRLAIGTDDVHIVKKKITTEGETVIEEPWAPTTSDLYPDPIKLPQTGAVTSTDVKIQVSAITTVKLNASDIEEYINVAKIMYGGDERYAVLSEFALCTGADRQVTVQSTSGNINFVESIGTQAFAFAADHKAVYYNSQELTLDFDVGAQIPLLGTASIPTLETIGTLAANPNEVTP